MTAHKRQPPMRWCRVDGTHISFVEVGVPIPDELWDQCVGSRREPSVERCLKIVAGDGFPQISHRQWRYSVSVLIERQFPVAVLTSHRSMLAIVRAASWNGARIRPFCWLELDDALAFIDVPQQQRESVRLMAERLRDGLSVC